MRKVVVDDKLPQQLVSTKRTLVLRIFIELRKAYDVLNWDHFLDILCGYGIRPMVLILIS